ncbi:GGDEF domain-containing protein [Thiospirillum jenense]|uniref:GGDEF domain-containing protein n=1 Tax=Thiospirillum jenense TaxID=1653858 RepID=A0A839HCJ9_9GAMM|nr:GGDEF domain-containing protein [Thiospirillum jenense]MBB1125870.1 GGDEF domain-containing protein [Thiospirillum jenense]
MIVATTDMPSRTEEFALIWAALHEQLTYTLQPIINVHTGTLFGYEAVLQGHIELGFESVSTLLTYAENNGVLSYLARLLIERAVTVFAATHPGERNRIRLLLQIAPRTLNSVPLLGEHIAAVAARYQLPTACICFELQDTQSLSFYPQVQNIIHTLRQQRYLFLIDEFGASYSGLKHLYELNPDMIKLDRFFVANLATNHRQHLFVSHIIQLAHTLGIQVIAATIETTEEFIACREIGCDFAQGQFVIDPSIQSTNLLKEHCQIQQFAIPQRRQNDGDSSLIQTCIERLPVLCETDEMRTVFDFFRRYSDRSFFPVVDCCNRPLGLIHEQNLKSYIYSNYGRDLLANPAYNKKINHFILPCPGVEVNSTVKCLLDTYIAAGHPPGLIITENFYYTGFISQSALLHIIDTKNLADARDQNPLTRLPGNHNIVEYVNQILADIHTACCLVYLDFDHFKPFNDTYGFRIGDRAIMLFADLLRKQLNNQSCFIGHIGGDDFFVGFKHLAVEQVKEAVHTLLNIFAHEVQSFYDAAARERSYIEALNRHGEMTRFPLLGCSAAILVLPQATPRHTFDELSRIIAELKKQAKKSPDHIAIEYDLIAETQ